MNRSAGVAEVRVPQSDRNPDFAFIPFPTSLAALRWLRHMHRREFGRDRPLSLHIIGESGMGKSRILSHYTARYEGKERDTSGYRPRHIVLVEAPETGSIRTLCERLTHECLPGFEPRRSTQYVERIGAVLLHSGVRQVLIDEAGNLLNGGRLATQQTLATLKRLTNLGLTLGIATTENMRNVLAADEQLHSRFRQVHLARWQESDELRIFLAGLEAQLPLPRPSHLSSQRVVRWLLAHRYNTTGEIVNLICDATSRAQARGDSALTLDTLQEARDDPMPPPRPLEEG